MTSPVSPTLIDWLQCEAYDAGLKDIADEKLADHLDATDKLGNLRELFEYPKIKCLPQSDLTVADGDEDCMYLAGGSTGLMPKATARLYAEHLAKWASQGYFGRTTQPLPWHSLPDLCAEGVARLIGAKTCEVALMNALTVNIHVALTAFYKPTESRHKILLEQRAFPSDHYAIESQIRLNGGRVEDSMLLLSPRVGEEFLRTADILSYISEHGDSIAIIWLPGIQFFTGQLFDIEAITKAGHDKGCLVGWDLAHAFVNVPMYLNKWEVDFAAFSTYKYGCSGPGGIGGLFVHEKYKNDGRERMLGWWSERASMRLQTNNVLDLGEGAAGYQISTPPAFLLLGVLGLLEVMKPVDMEELRERSIHLTGYVEILIDRFFGETSPHRVSQTVAIRSLTPRDISERGCQLSLTFSVPAEGIYKELTRRGAAVTLRKGDNAGDPFSDIIRVAPHPLFNNFSDCRRFISALIEAAKLVDLHEQRHSA